MSENKRKRKVRSLLGSCQRAKNAVWYKGGCDTTYSWCSWNSQQGLVKKKGGIGNPL